MFKKLRQKIEEGGEGGLENVSFSPSKLPGSIVRATSLSDEERSHSPLLDIPLESQPPISAEVSKWDQQVTFSQSMAPPNIYIIMVCYRKENSLLT